MKKLIAISLLAIHVFNLAGYSLVFDHIIRQADRQLVTHLDHNVYDETRLVEVRIALHLPYIQGSFQYERVDGTLEHNGIQYNYVKRKLYNDTLSLLCIPNDQKTAIVRDAKHLTSELNDFPPGKKDKQSGLKKPVLSADYFSSPEEYTIGCPFIEGSSVATTRTQRPLAAFHARPDRPPCIVPVNA
ncbi:MAG: hypothetical protein EOO05_09630 [Chitinophagaceae bacterium]|nr:MAG: hypothetical protein EOO05_09630 [Chitinophagaceae bacterium]